MIQNIMTALKFGILSLCLFVAADYAVKRWVLDDTHWFEYEKVEFVEPVRQGAPVYMLSYSVWHRPADVTWNDALFCYLNPQDKRATRIRTPEPITDNNYFPAADGLPEPWKFLRSAPRAGLVCYSRHVITVRAGYGLEKRATVKSGKITIRG